MGPMPQTSETMEGGEEEEEEEGREEEREQSGAVAPSLVLPAGGDFFFFFFSFKPRRTRRWRWRCGRWATKKRVGRRKGRGSKGERRWRRWRWRRVWGVALRRNSLSVSFFAAFISLIRPINWPILKPSKRTIETAVAGARVLSRLFIYLARPILEHWRRTTQSVSPFLLRPVTGPIIEYRNRVLGLLDTGRLQV